MDHQRKTEDGLVVTSIPIKNLHCASCQTTISEILGDLRPPPSRIDASIVTQVVTVYHDSSISTAVIRKHLLDAGFEIENESGVKGRRSMYGIKFLEDFSKRRRLQRHLKVCGSCQAARRRDLESSPPMTLPAASPTRESGESLSKADGDFSTPFVTVESAHRLGQDKHRVSMSIGGMSCASCTNAVRSAIEDIPGVSEVAVDLMGKSATAVVIRKDLAGVLKKRIEEAGYEAEIVALEPTEQLSNESGSDVWTADFDVQGMTCASCVGNVRAAVEKLPFVRSVEVSLLSHNAIVTFPNKDQVHAITNAIDSTGYESRLVQLVPPTTAGESVERTISFRVDGMFGACCPPQVLAALQQLADRVKVEKALTLEDPIVRLAYTPKPPMFTLRHIAKSIAAVRPEFRVSVSHPPSLEERARAMQAREQQHLLWRLLASAVVAIPTFIIGVVFISLVKSDNPTRRYLEEPMWVGSASRMEWALFFLSTPVMFFMADVFHRRSVKEIWALWRPGSTIPIYRRFFRFGSMNLLVSLGVSLAYFASVALLAISASLPMGANRMPGVTTTYFDSVVFLTMFLLSGRYLEAYSKRRTTDAVDMLGKLRPTEALLVIQKDQELEEPHRGAGNKEANQEDNVLQVERISVDMLEVGDVVRVPVGVSPPADGTIVSNGEGSFDESSLTGESRPVAKHRGDPVFAGTVNLSQVVLVQVDVPSGKTMLDQIVNVVRQGATRRAPIERIADKVTGYFVPVITLAAILTWVIWLTLGLGGVLPPSYLDVRVGGWPLWSLEFAIAVFVIACPCGIGLAAPTALFVGSGLAARHGILVRGGGEAFQEGSRLDVIVFDKTGTLTEGGQPTVAEIDVSSEHDRNIVLSIASELESNSAHPLALAIREFCTKEELLPVIGNDIEERPGRGLKGTFQLAGSDVFYEAVIGNEAWLDEHDAKLNDAKRAASHGWKEQGRSVVLLAIRSAGNWRNGAPPSTEPFVLAAIFAVTDPIRKEAPGVVDNLQRQGIEIWMISGDNEITAKAVARSVGIPGDKVIAGVLPQGKAEKITWLQKAGIKRTRRTWWPMLGRSDSKSERAVVAMVGDGINDAPALATSDVGIAIASGSDIAISSAQFILMSSDLRSVPTLMDLSSVVIRRVKFNFVWACIYNIIALPVAAGIIYPIPGHYRLNPVWASLAMALSSVSVVCSSLLLKLYQPPKIA